jgi:hypothetical protein
MRQIVRLRLPPAACPDAAPALDPAGRALLTAIRWWQAMPDAATPVHAADRQLAERALRTALLAAPGAEFALGPLQGLADLFAVASQAFRHATQPGARHAPFDTARPWITPAIPETIH